MGTTKLEFVVDGQNLNAPLAFSDIEYASLSGNDYAVSGSRLRKGVFFKSNTSGSFMVITLAEYRRRGGEDYDDNAPPTTGQRNTILRACTKQTVYLAAYQWVDVPVVFIDKSSAASNNLNIGLY